MRFERFILVLVFGPIIHSSSVGFEYPVQIKEFGELVISEPIIKECPNGVELLLPLPIVPLRSTFQRLPLGIKIRPELLVNISLETISKYFFWKKVTPYFEGASYSELDLHFINALKRHLNAFNPSFLEGDASYSSLQILAIGVVLLPIFKAAYPGLYMVKLSKREIAFLSIIASCWFMSRQNLRNQLHHFVYRAIIIYFPEFDYYSEFTFLTYNELLERNLDISFQAACHLKENRIISPGLCLYRLTQNLKLTNLLENRDHFLKASPIMTFTDGEYSNMHLLDWKHLLYFIKLKASPFYPEPFLHSELKTVLIPNAENFFFELFFSEALFYSLRFCNSDAIRFFLNLDYSSYFAPGAETIGPYISHKTFHQLRGIFLSESMDQIIEQVPNFESFRFCNMRTAFFIRYMKNDFISLMEIDRYLESKNRSIKICGTKRPISQIN